MTDSSEANAEAGKASGFSFAGIGTHTLIYGLGILLNRAIGFIMLPIYTRLLTPDDYGLIALIEMSLDMFAILAGTQLALGVFRFYHKAETEFERNGVVSTALFSLGIAYAFVGSGAFLAAPLIADVVLGSQENVHLIRVAAVNLGMGSLLTVPLAYARVRDLSRFFVIINAVKLGLTVVLNLWFLMGMGLGPLGVFLSSLIANTLIGIWLVYWVIRQVGTRFSRDATRDLLRYGVPLMGMQAATFLATFGDRFFLNAHWDTAVVGIYNLGYQFGFLLAAVGYMPFEQVWGPKRFEVAKRDDRDQIYARTFVYVNLVLITLAVCISVGVRDVLRVMAESSFWTAADFVPLIVVAYVLQCWASVQDIGILVREKTLYVAAANWVAAGVALLGYWILVPPWGGWGAAWATVAAFFCRWSTTYWASQRLWRVEYDWLPVLKLATIGAAAVFVAIQLSPEAFVASVGFRALVLLAYGCVVWWAGVLTPDEKSTVVSTGKGLWAQVVRARRHRAGVASGSARPR